MFARRAANRNNGGVPSLLKKLKVKEVSLVPRGANKGARVLLHKGAATMAVPAWASHLTGERRVSNPLSRFMDSLRSAVSRVAKSDADKAAVDAAFDDAEESLAAEVDAALDERDDGDEEFDAALAAAAAKRKKKADGGGDDDEDAEDKGEVEKSTVEESEMPDEAAVLKMFGAANVAELQAKIEKANQAAAENATLKAEIERVSKAAAASNEKLEKMLAESARVARVAKARELLGNVPANDERVDALATVMAKLDTTETDALAKVLKAASDAVEAANLFEPSRVIRTDNANSANAQLAQIAKTIESAENVSAVVAMQRAMARNKPLAARAVSEDTNTFAPQPS